MTTKLETGDQMEPILKRFIIHGKVQQVGYRKWTKKTALADGLEGFCRNRSDGTVEVVAKGKPEVLEAFEKKLEDGPKRAVVRQVMVKKRTRDVKPGFRILKTRNLESQDT